MDANQLDDVMKVVKQIDLNKQVIESDNEFESDTKDVLPEITDSDAVIEEVTVAETVIDYKSKREKTLKVRAEPMKVCGYCNEKTNEHTKTTCPKNPKARRKKKATPIIDV
ncbi:hypothetical protein Tco_0117182 [Tanacetum coccineum]